MRLQRYALIAALFLSATAGLPGLAQADPQPPPAAPEALTPRVRLPIILRPTACPATSGNSYTSGIMYQYDTDNPVRPAWNHADKNLDLRGYSATSGTKALINIGRDPNETSQPPQLATLFSPARVPTISTLYRVNNWNWATSPNPGTRGTPITNPAVTLLGLATTPGEQLHASTHGRNIGNDFGLGGSMVIYADANSVTLHFTREDSAARGYTVHVDNICTDPNLLALYNALDGGARYAYPSPGYNLPGLTAGKVFGTARGAEIGVALVDTGAFMDPRSCLEWWEIRPGYTC